MKVKFAKKRISETSQPWQGSLLRREVGGRAGSFGGAEDAEGGSGAQDVDDEENRAFNNNKRKGGRETCP